MAMTPNDTILGPARGSFMVAWDFATDADAHRLEHVEDYLAEVYRLAPLVGMDPAILVAQSAHETANWTSYWWRLRLNPAGLGINGDPRQNEASGYWANGTDAARAQICHLAAYVGVEHIEKFELIDKYIHLDPRLQAVIDANLDGTVRTIADLAGKWATDPAYHTKIAAKGNLIFPGIPDQHPQEEPMARPKILLIAGHRSYNDGGNTGEKALTPALAADYYEALHDAGYGVWWLQRDVDGDADPDDTVGGLDTVSRLAYLWGTGNAGPKVLLDLHYGGEGVRGVFAIIPDVTGLRTGAPMTQLATDTWENNVFDRRVAKVWIDQVRQRTGIPLRTVGVREPGLMDEHQTGVGLEHGARLATFAYTSPLASEMTRLVLEHGNLNPAAPNDREIIFTDDFTQKCAAAALVAIGTVYGVAEIPPIVPEPAPDEPKHQLPPGMSPGMARRLYGAYDAPWDVLYQFNLAKAASQVWLARGKRSIPNGSTWEDEKARWPRLIEVIRRGKEGDRGFVYRWSDGSTYWSKPRS